MANGVAKGRDLYATTRQQQPSKTYEQLAATNTGRGQLLSKARAGDSEAREALSKVRAQLSDGARAVLDGGVGSDDAA